MCVFFFAPSGVRACVCLFRVVCVPVCGCVCLFKVVYVLCALAWVCLDMLGGVNMRDILVCCQTNGVTPLHIACLHRHTKVVAALLAAGASVDAVTVCTVPVQAVMLYLNVSSMYWCTSSSTLL